MAGGKREAAYDKDYGEVDMSTSWADQWDYAGDLPSESTSRTNNSSRRASARSKIISGFSKAKSAASVGARKIKKGSGRLIPRCLNKKA